VIGGRPQFRADHVGSLLRPAALRVTGRLSLEKCIFAQNCG
jgi:methionine synthase II (cobalamin-independent)